MKSFSLCRNVSLGLFVGLVIAGHCIVDAKEDKKAEDKKAPKVTTPTNVATTLAKQIAPLGSANNQTTGKAPASGLSTTSSTTKKPEKKELAKKDLAKKKSSRSVTSGGPAPLDKLKQPSDLTTAEGHEKKYMIVKKKPKKKKPKKIKMKIYEPKIKYKKVKVKVPVKKYKKKKVKGYLVKKHHHHY